MDLLTPVPTGAAAARAAEAARSELPARDSGSARKRLSRNRSKLRTLKVDLVGLTDPLQEEFGVPREFLATLAHHILLMLEAARDIGMARAALEGPPDEAQVD